MSARSFRVLWALEALGLDFELTMLPFPPRAHRREFLSVNVLGTVPVFSDGSVVMTESAAICEYLATRHAPETLGVLPKEEDYGSYLDWLHRGEATLTFPQTLVLRYGRLEPEERRQPQVVEDYARWFLARLKGLEAGLADRRYLCAGRLTVADISVGYALMLADYLGLADRFTVNVGSYWKRLGDEPSYRAALVTQDAAARAQGISTVPAPLTGGP